METIIYSFDAKKIFLYGKTIIKEKVISLSAEMTSLARSSNDGESSDVERKRNCLLFDQLKKEFGPSFNISEHIIQIDFKTASESICEKLKEHRNGIELDFGNGKKRFVLFLRSASMSRKSRTYYIDKEIYERANRRVCFDLINSETRTTLSKWYAYSGLCISDCDILQNIKLESKNVVVVPDTTKTVLTNCLTAISEPYIISLMQKLLHDYKCSLNDFNNTVHNIRAIMESKEFEELDNELSAQKMISYFESTKRIIDNDMKGKGLLSQMIKDYALDCENNKESIKWYKVNVKDFIVSTSLFDGEGLCDGSFSKEILKELSFTKGTSKKEKSGSFQFRLPFVKGVLHSCNLQRFFKDKGISTIEGLTFNIDKQPKIKKYDVRDIKVILTESQFKLAKYIKNLPSHEGEDKIDAYFRIINEYNYGFGVCNLEPKQKRLVELNYEVLSTMPVSKSTIKKIIKQNKKEMTESLKGEKMFERYVDKDGNPLEYYNDKYELYAKDPSFYRTTKIYEEDKEDYKNSLRNNCFSGHIKVGGQRKFLSGDLLDLLYKACGIEMSKEQAMGLYEYFVIPHKQRKEELKSVALLRNPHYARNEIAVLNPHIKDNDERSLYFSHLKGTIFVNASSLTAERLSGADYDGDQVIVVNQPEIVSDLKKKLFSINTTKKVPVVPKYNLIIIPSLTAEGHQYNYANQIECMRNTFYNQVGLISNSAFYKTFKCYKNKKDYDEVAFYTILGGLAIDCAKTGLKPDLSNYILKKDKYSFGSLFLDGLKKNKNDSFEAYYIKALKSKNDDSVLGNIAAEFLENTEDSKTRKTPNIKAVYDKDNCYQIAKCIAEYNFWFGKDNPFIFGDNLVKSKERLYALIKNNYSTNDQDDLDAIINEYHMSNPFVYYQRYCLADYNLKYHFIENVFDRKQHIRWNLLLKNVGARYLKYVTCFSNEGFKTLYLILRYWSDYEKFDLTNNTYLSIYCEDHGFSENLEVIESLNIDEKQFREDFYKDIADDYKLISSYGLGFIHLSKDEEKECKTIILNAIRSRIPSSSTINNFVAVQNDILENVNLLKLYKSALLKYLEKGRK